MIIVAYTYSTGPALAGGGGNTYKTDMQKRGFWKERKFRANQNNEKIQPRILLENKEWLSVGILSLIGIAGGFIASYFIDELKKPLIKFKVGSIGKGIPGRKWRFIHIKIINKHKRKFSPFSVSPAFAVKATVKIGKEEFTGRWTSKGEPLISTLLGQIIDPNAVLVVPREDIQPSKGEENAVEVAIGMKYEGETEFYGFNNESYLNQPLLKNNKWKFASGNHKGKITLSTLGGIYTKEFIVHNKSKKRSEFYLELIEREK